MNETSIQARPRRPRVELEPLEPGLESRYYTDPRVADLEQRRIFDRTWQLVGHVTDLPNPGSRIVGSVGTQGGRRRSRRGRQHPRAPQHLPPSRHPPGRRPGRGEGAAMPVPRLDLPPRRNARRRTREPHHPVPGQVEAVVVRRARRGVLRTDLRQPRSGRGAARAAARGSAAAVGALSRAARWNRSARHASTSTIQSTSRQSNWKVAVDNYLEGYHVPVAHPGLMRLLDYKSYSVETAHAYAFTTRRCGTSRRTTGPSGCTSGWSARCRASTHEDERRLQVHRDLPEHRDRPLSRPRADLEDEPPRRGPGRRPGYVPAPQGLRPAYPHRAATQPLPEQNHHARGRGPGAANADRPG